MNFEIVKNQNTQTLTSSPKKAVHVVTACGFTVCHSPVSSGRKSVEGSKGGDPTISKINGPCCLLRPWSLQDSWFRVWVSSSVSSWGRDQSTPGAFLDAHTRNAMISQCFFFREGGSEGRGTPKPHKRQETEGWVGGWVVVKVETAERGSGKGSSRNWLRLLLSSCCCPKPSKTKTQKKVANFD